MKIKRRAVTALIAMAFVGSVFLFALSLLRPPESDSRRFLSFSVEQGESYKSVSLRLKSEGLIRFEPFFYYVGRASGKSASLKAGEYELNTEMSAWEILSVITGSHVKLYRVTLREGINMFQVAQTLEDLGLVDKMQFLESCWDSQFLEELHIPSPTVEGYLFPETYYIPRGSSPRAIIRIFVDMFWNRVPQSYIDEAKTGNLSFHEAVIMASMIEKETGLVGEMAIISSAFYNRIDRRMKLQSDPTAVYDILPLGGRVLRDHLFRKTAFNTYSIEGLPLTPISNPGILAIYAALHPQRTDYLYFVSRRDGSHHFSATFEEHKEAIEKYLK
ncbi:MAG: Endolytic murein transglycosylase [Bacteriovoracaceae bacterium]|nr:Endolytic murein transglycosylase [Bacteriovoracaceae bacterium]